jgi:hypothetical protein
MCGQFTSNGHMAGNCPSMSGLQQDRTTTLYNYLLSLLERHNGGRWEAITADFANKPIKSFASPIPINTPLDCHPTPRTYMPTRLVAHVTRITNAATSQLKRFELGNGINV